MDTNMLMAIDWLYKTIGVDFVNMWIKLLFTTACVVAICIMLSFIMVFSNLAALIRPQTPKDAKEYVSPWQIIKSWFPKKDKAQINI